MRERDIIESATVSLLVEGGLVLAIFVFLTALVAWGKL